MVLQRPGPRRARSPQAKQLPFQMLLPGSPWVALPSDSRNVRRLQCHAPADNLGTFRRLRPQDISVKMKNLAAVADFWPSSPVLFEGADLLAA